MSPSTKVFQVLVSVWDKPTTWLAHVELTISWKSQILPTLRQLGPTPQLRTRTRPTPFPWGEAACFQPPSSIQALGSSLLCSFTNPSQSFRPPQANLPWAP